ncbi:MAG: sulfotransferase domain-containing protein [Synechococcus sp.]
MNFFRRTETTNIRVGFVVAGTQKGGTSALDIYLRKHPDMMMATKKEVHFFDREKNFLESVDYDKYHSFFDRERQVKIIGEATPIYMYWKSSPKRIWQYNPKMKFIILLRNPIERAFSHWNMERSRGNDSFSFWDAISNETERCRESYPLQHRVYSYIDRGFYCQQLERIWCFFPKRQTYIIKSENLRENPIETLREIASFLGVDDFSDVACIDAHSIPYTTEMTEREYQYLVDVFSDEIQRLEKILGWDCSSWLR